MAEKGVAVLLMFVLLISGIALTLNLPLMLGIDLGIGFKDIHNLITGIWILLLKLVGIILTALSIFVIINIIKN